jgi:hypothetical protein
VLRTEITKRFQSIALALTQILAGAESAAKRKMKEQRTGDSIGYSVAAKFTVRGTFAVRKSRQARAIAPYGVTMVIVVVMLVFGAIGGFWASSKSLNPWLWALLCACFPVIGLIILAFQRPALLPVTGGMGTDRWSALVEVDAEIAAAAREARSLGHGYEDMLAQKYLALNDKSYLPNLLETIRAAAKAEPNLPPVIGQVRFSQLPDGRFKIIEGLGAGKVFPDLPTLKRYIGSP